MKKLLTRNLGLKLASLVLAFVLWFLVAQIYDPKDTVTFNNIQVRLINTDLLEQEGKVYEVLDNSNLVRVTVTGPQSIVKSELRRNDIVAEADMSKLTDINTIAITYYCENISNDSVEIRGNKDNEVYIAADGTVSVKTEFTPTDSTLKKLSEELIETISKNKVEMTSKDLKNKKITFKIAEGKVSDYTTSTN